jgi:hypothetical protein
VLTTDAERFDIAGAFDSRAPRARDAALRVIICLARGLAAQDER